MTAAESFLDGKVILRPGDCLEVMPTLDANSIDSIVSDPPYGLGFMGKSWDHGVPGVAYWKQAFRVLKPGGHLVAFGGTRTYHRMACAIEDAGFEIRDCLQWLYGSGFPKSHDVSKGIDRAACERVIIGTRTVAIDKRTAEGRRRTDLGESGSYEVPITAPSTDAARQWSGWGTALKPAQEPIVLARKPLIGTVAENVLKHGTGALNIDGCRVGTDARINISASSNEIYGQFKGAETEGGAAIGRWPANVVHDGSDEVVGAFPEGRSAGDYPSDSHGTGNGVTYLPTKPQGNLYSDSGSAARFFYTAKADADDRLGSKHPTVKPLDLMQWLVRLVTPPGGTLLDPFAGTGTTGEAAFREGFRAVLIQRGSSEDELAYLDDIRRRMALCVAGPEERKRESIKARLKDGPQDAGPLFAGSETPPRRGRQIYGVFAEDNRTDGIEVVIP